MPDRPLRLVGDHQAPRRCRTRGCPMLSSTSRGYCSPCNDVYVAAQELRERLLARRGARLEVQHRDMLSRLAPSVRARLLAHVAANAAAHGLDVATLDLAGLEDFLAELRELGLTQ